MKVIVACDGRDLASFLAAAGRTVALQSAEVVLAHVIDESFPEAWRQVASHHWPGRHAEPRDPPRVQEAARRLAKDVLDDALALTSEWPAAIRRSVDLVGNPERELVRLVLEERADLIVVGQHRFELGPHALGRCARFVVDHAPCQVLLVRDEAFRAGGAALLGSRLSKLDGQPRRSPDR